MRVVRKRRGGWADAGVGGQAWCASVRQLSTVRCLPRMRGGWAVVDDLKRRTASGQRGHGRDGPVGLMPRLGCRVRRRDGDGAVPRVRRLRGRERRREVRIVERWIRRDRGRPRAQHVGRVGRDACPSRWILKVALRQLLVVQLSESVQIAPLQERKEENVPLVWPPRRSRNPGSASAARGRRRSPGP